MRWWCWAISTRHLAGGRVRLHADLAHRAIAERVAAPLGVVRGRGGVGGLCSLPRRT